MNKYIFLTFAAAIAGLPVSSLAQGFDGATLTLGYDASNDEDYYSSDLRGSAAFAFGSFGGQLDLGFVNNGSYNEEQQSAGLHAYYVTGTGLAVGVFGSRYLQGGTWSSHSGLEVGYANDKLSLEAYAGQNIDDTGSFDFNTYGISAGYDLGRVGIIGAAHGYSLGNRSSVLAGISYEVTDALSVEATYGVYTYPSGQQDNFGLKVVYAVGNGARFKQRDFAALFPNF